MTTAPVRDLDTASAVLDYARGQHRAAEVAEANLLQAAVAWAAMHSVDSLDDAAVHAGFGDQPMPVAGAGAPLVAEFAVTEFAAAIGRSSESGKHFLGQAVELRHRLPRIWRRVVEGRLSPWKARKVAAKTVTLSAEAADWVDRHAAPVAQKLGPVQLTRLVDDAVARYMPETAEQKWLTATGGRHFTIDPAGEAFDGTAEVHGTLDIADAHDLDDAIAGIAGQLKELGSEESLDVRRAKAVGELARAQLALDLAADGDAASVEPVETKPRSRRRVILYVHLSDGALAGVPGTAVLERGHTQVTAGQVRDWCHTAGQITVRPVLDPWNPEPHDPVDAPDVPDRHAELIAVRAKTCVFPWCTRPARRCDCDHITPYNKAGPTCPSNLAPLCRRHHRIKTHGGWTYTPLEPGVYLWTSHHGLQYLRDHDGTLDVSPDHRAPD